MGVIGDTLRMDAGVVSDSVNTASRMEGLTKQFGVNILLSETTATELSDSFSLRSLGKVLVKGRKTAIGIFECFDGDLDDEIQKKSKTTAKHQEALNLYLDKSFAQALRIWDRLSQIAPDDRVILRFRNCARHALWKAYRKTGKE